MAVLSSVVVAQDRAVVLVLVLQGEAQDTEAQEAQEAQAADHPMAVH